MNQFSRLVSLLAVSIAISFISVSPAHSSKVGDKCSKVGLTLGVGSKKLTCLKKGKFLVWVQTPAISLGSSSRPVPFGMSIKIGSIQYSASKVNLDANQLICSENAFNEGCALDDNLKSKVDPNSPISWVTVSLRAQNLGNSIVKPGGFDKTFFLALTNGQLLQEEEFVLFPNSFSELQLISGGFGIGDAAFALPKSGSSISTLLILRDSSNLLKPKDYYFEIRF